MGSRSKIYKHHKELSYETRNLKALFKSRKLDVLRSTSCLKELSIDDLKDFISSANHDNQRLSQTVKKPVRSLHCSIRTRQSKERLEKEHLERELSNGDPGNQYIGLLIDDCF